jgi:GAF domain-containing protein
MTQVVDHAATDPWQIIADLQRKLDESRAELAERDSQYGERIEQQSATVDVLKVMSASPGDPQPVFDLITRRARELCNANAAALWSFDGELIHFLSNDAPGSTSEMAAAYRRQFPMAPTRGGSFGRAILDRQIVHIRDVDADPEIAQFVRDLGMRSIVAAPLLRDGTVIGAISINAKEPGGLSDGQVALLETFAEQAVIAITSAETYRELQQRTGDLQETLEYQTATSEVLKVISRSTFDIQPVFETIVETAARLCDADYANITSREGDVYRMIATSSQSPESSRIRPGHLFPINRESLTGRTAVEGRIVHIHDVAADPEYAPAFTGQFRTGLGVPLLREGGVVGTINLGRNRVQPFTDREIELVRTFADQAVIALENARLINETREALDQQTATAEVLQVINASPGDLGPVFDAMLEKAMRLCEAACGTLWIYDGASSYHAVANHNVSADYAEFVTRGPITFGPESGMGRIESGEPFFQFADLASDDRISDNPLRRTLQELSGSRTVVFVPLRRDTALLGIFTIYRQEVRPFSDKQIALLENFAAQAVIAMENARLITETREALDQQTATAEVLQVINSSPGDLAPVFDAILEKAHSLCGVDYGTLRIYDGEKFSAVATRGYPEGVGEVLRRPYAPEPNSDSWELLDGAPLVEIPDMIEHRARAPNPRIDAAIAIGIRSVLLLPLHKDNLLLGLISAARKEASRFTEKQITLLQNFASQAVIAMENARLITETREALEQQTATAEVLQVINSSPGDLAPVFDALLEKAMRLCGADFGRLLTYDGQQARFAASRGVPQAFAELRQKNPQAYGPGTGPAMILAGERVVHIADLRDTDAFRSGDFNRRSLVELGGARTALMVGLIKDDAVLGNIMIYRQEVRPFSEKQIVLLQNFAAQAVIAMENARLITETREALDQQTATAEVLGVINASPGDLAPVFDAMLEKAMRLCEATFGQLGTYDGERFRTAATRGVPAAYVEYRKSNPPKYGPGTTPFRILAGERVIRTDDFKAEPAYQSGEPNRRAIVDLGGARSNLAVALRKDSAVLGFIEFYRQEVRPFTDKQVSLLENFAAQAVIAMENARLITETREALEQQTATAEVLQVINSSPGDLTPVFDAILEKAARLCGAAFGLMSTYDGEQYHTVATHGVGPELAEFMRAPPNPDPGSAIGRIQLGEDLVLFDDLADTDIYRKGDPRRRAIVDLGGAHSYAVVALRKDRRLLGIIAAYRREVRPFSEKQVALLQNFAAQAVIAIENARLITETREALEQQTATAEVLQVINSSPGNLAPVFDAILEKAHALCGAAFGGLLLYDGENTRAVATRGVPEALADLLRQPLSPGPDGPVARLIAGDRFYQIADQAELLSSSPNPRARNTFELAGIRTVLFVPLRRDDALLGVITVYRQEVRPFAAKEIALLENFAAQAVIAMENARLITETREALEQQTATAEVLQVINSSPGDLTPVFDAILEKAHTLCGATHGALGTYDADYYFRSVVARGYPQLLAERLQQGFDGLTNPVTRPLIDGARFVHIPDLAEIDHPIPQAVASLGGFHTGLFLPLRKDGTLLGHISATRSEVRPFAEKEIALLQNFAAQAVIAMENARLITETREALEQQTATAEVLQVINSSPGDLSPVFDAVLDKALRLCGANFGLMNTYDGEHFHHAADHGVPAAYAKFRRDRGPTVYGSGTTPARLVAGEGLVHTLDLMATEPYEQGDRTLRALVDVGGARTSIGVALRKDGVLLGYMTAYRQEVRPFSDKQIALLENFAAQAVIAMENARLLNEIRQRQAELRVTFDNMADGVAMFDEGLRLTAWNRNFQQIADLPEALLAERPSYPDYLRILTERGELDIRSIDAELSRRLEHTDQELRLERTRPDGRVIEVRRNAVPDGGFVLIYSDITERKRSEAEIRAARDTAEATLRDLRAAQANLIQAEKMASLGQLTAGIAHEIKNPLNFVTNFADLSGELLKELKEAAEPGWAALDQDKRAEIDETIEMLTGNLEKIGEHGRRADGIVKSMLEHSRGVTSERRVVDLNNLIEEALNLAYHGARAQDQTFNILMDRDFDRDLARIELVPQEMSRVFINLFGNGFYAATKRQRESAETEFQPTLTVATRDFGDTVEVRVRDNGTGVPPEIRDKLFQPFFTTKPTGEGTGLGLSISYDIVTQQHGGTIEVDSRVGEFTEFTIRLPRSSDAASTGAAA